MSPKSFLLKLRSCIKSSAVLCGYRSLERAAGRAVAALLLGVVATAAQAGPHRVLLLTGVNNHNWEATTPQIEAALREAGLFDVTVRVTPPVDAPQEVWQTNQFDFPAYAAVVMNWTDYGKPAGTRPWMDQLVDYVRAGGGLVIVHAASLESHPAWPELCGLGWHKADFGDRLTVDDQGGVVRTPKGEGPGSGHGKPFAWDVTMRATNHPVATGLPRTWRHAEDELWHGTRGPAKNLEIIATAFSPITKANEPVMWTVTPGRGRVFVTLLGHHAQAMQCVGFRHTLARGCEWVIAGRVTLPAPADFPQPAETTETGPRK